MQTESLGQMIDRLIIAALKHWHYTHDGKTEAAELAQEQVDQLSMAIGVYDWECRAGRRQPIVNHHLRYHNHNDVEAFRPGKQATPNVPAMLSGCIVALVQAHSSYWENQGRLQTLKRLADGAPEQERGHFATEFMRVQRATDLDNQYRNQVTQQIDTIYAIGLDRKPDIDGEALKEAVRKVLAQQTAQKLAPLVEGDWSRADWS